MTRRPRGLSQAELLDWCLAEGSAWDGRCLVWLGARTTDGYAQTSANSRRLLVPRLILAQRQGVDVFDLGADVQALHSCDRGHEGCVLPEHISAGSRAQNMQDAYDRGRILQGRCSRGHAMVGANVVRYEAFGNMCRTCYRARNRKAKRPITMDQAIAEVLAEPKWADMARDALG